MVFMNSDNSTGDTNARDLIYRVDLTVDRRSGPVRKAIEGKNLDKLLARVERANGYSVEYASTYDPR